MFYYLTIKKPYKNDSSYSHNINEMSEIFIPVAFEFHEMFVYHMKVMKHNIVTLEIVEYSKEKRYVFFEVVTPI